MRFSYFMANPLFRFPELVLALSVPLLLTPGAMAQNYYGYGAPPAPSSPMDGNASFSQASDYERYSDEGSRFFNAGQMTQAIQSFEKALAAAPPEALPYVYNNLAVVYIKRGNYYHEHLKQDINTLSDYRKAFFYLELAWPEGMERKPLYEKNRIVSRENMGIVYKNLNINPADRSKHLEMARQLRMQGKFQEAIVEYSQALELNKQDAATAKALGDLFTVVNLPEKAKKYYGQAVGPNVTASSGVAQDETLVQLGNAQYKTGEIDKAVSNFDKALAINPGNISALNMLEKIWLNEVKFNPTSVLGHANLGSVYQKKKMYDLAFQQYNAAEMFSERDKTTPFDVKKLIRLNMGTLFQAQKRYDLAIKAYDTVLQVEPNHQQALFYKATLLQDTGNTDGAFQAYDRLLSINPDYAPAREKMLGIIHQQTDPAKLAAGLRQYADRFANDATVQAKIGEEFHQRKDLNNAAFYYQRAIQKNPSMAAVWANLGAIYQAQDKDEESAEAFQKALALEPQNATFKELAQGALGDAGYKQYQQAVTLQQQGKTTEALDAFKKALQTADKAEIHAAYGVALQSSGQLDAAIGEYQKALAQEAGNADYAYYLGTAYHQKKDFAKAEAAYKKALSLKPTYTEARQAMDSIAQQGASQDLSKAIDAYNRQNYVGALTFANQAVTKNPQDPMAYYYKGLILDAQKKPSLAAQSYRQAIQRKADFSDAYYALAVALEASRDSHGAKTAFEKFLSLSQGHEDDFVKYARERVKAIP